MAETKHSISPAPYASSDDFHRIFYAENDSLYRLSFLLTADRGRAEQCFVSGLQESVNGSPVFKEWALLMGSADDHSKRRKSHQPTPTGGTCPFEFSTVVAQRWQWSR